MKTIKLLTIILSVTVLCLFVGCSENQPNNEGIQTENSTTKYNWGEKETEEIMEDNTVKNISTQFELAELIEVDFIEADIKITEITCTDYEVWVLCKGADDALDPLLSDDMSNFSEVEFSDFLLSEIRVLEEMGFTENNVLKRATKGRIKDRVPNLDSDWLTEWYQLDTNHDKDGNILLYAYFPYNIVVDVDTIMAKQ